jgi:hypothetical protein
LKLNFGNAQPVVTGNLTAEAANGTCLALADQADIPSRRHFQSPKAHVTRMCGGMFSHMPAGSLTVCDSPAALTRHPDTVTRNIGVRNQSLPQGHFKISHFL